MLLAIACAGAGLSTIVVDRQDPAAMAADRFDGRSSAIAYGSRLVFDGIGLWPEIAGDAEPIREIRVADDNSPLFLHYDHRELGSGTGGNAPLGYIVENRVLRRALLTRAATLPSLKQLAPQTVAAMEASETGAEIVLGDGLRLRARFADFLGAIEPVGPRWAYPLALMQAERYVARRLALIGEAAHVIHPIAGQGLNIGIRDIAALAELIVDARRLGLDIGDPAGLDNYQRWRRADALLLAAVTDGLNRLFSNTVGTVRLAGGLGLAIVNRLPPL